MELKELLPIILAQYAFTLPYFVIWTIGLILAASRKRLHPGPSQVALIGLAILFLQLLITTPLNTLLPLILEDQGRSMVEIVLITAGIGFVGMIFGSLTLDIANIGVNVYAPGTYTWQLPPGTYPFTAWTIACGGKVESAVTIQSGYVTYGRFYCALDSLKTSSVAPPGINP